MANEKTMSFSKAQEQFGLTADKAVTRKFEAVIVTITSKDRKFLGTCGFSDTEDEMLLLYAKAATTTKSGRQWKEGEWCLVPLPE